jgi:glycerophosphoryl diester phosphodiesterase
MIDFKNTLLLGHRGARGEALENTLSGFEYAQKLQLSGLAGIEFDVQLSRDGQLIVFHDDTLERMCAQQSRLDQLNVSEIQRYRQFGQPIITLPCIAPTLNTYRYIELEIKTHSRTDYAKLVKALIRDLIDSPLASLPIVLTSFDVELHARLQRTTLLKHMPRGLLIREPKLLQQAPNTALQLGCGQLGIHYPLLNDKVIQHCHRYNLPVSAWTVNDIETIKQLIAWQVDVIITDYPSHILTL